MLYVFSVSESSRARAGASGQRNEKSTLGTFGGEAEAGAIFFIFPLVTL
jgi:hypothetical protein